MQQPSIETLLAQADTAGDHCWKDLCNAVLAYGPDNALQLSAHMAAAAFDPASKSPGHSLVAMAAAAGLVEAIQRICRNVAVEAGEVSP